MPERLGLAEAPGWVAARLRGRTGTRWVGVVTTDVSDSQRAMARREPRQVGEGQPRREANAALKVADGVITADALAGSGR